MAYAVDLATRTNRYGQSVSIEEFCQAWIAGGGKTPTQSPPVQRKPLISKELYTLLFFLCTPNLLLQNDKNCQNKNNKATKDKCNTYT